jgi:transcriptional regulator with XRE-family HTH domain
MPSPAPYNAVGPIIRRLRVERGWTQDALAAKLQIAGWDCTRSWLAKIEAGQVYVRDYQIVFFCRVLGVELTELLPKTAHSKIMRLFSKSPA